MAVKYSDFVWDTVFSIQDPIYTSYLDVETFIEIYGKLLTTLNGEDADSYIDLFFERSPINNTILIFVNEDAKEDFADMAVDMKLIPDIKELCEGESKQDKLRRSLKEMGIRSSNKKKVKERVEPSFEEKTKRKIAGMQKEIAKLRSRLQNEPEIGVRDEINKKILHLTSLIENKNFTV